ncbi:MAG: ArsR family transcriptional regulator, partial [Chloroflexi bacterium]|nr:ArsR family transcriptional regulator [Chloroflexota bacterium]
MQATRQRILEILKERGAATVEELGSDLDLTPVTIRHHLDILRNEGLIQAPKVKRRDAPGRPQH